MTRVEASLPRAGWRALIGAAGADRIGHPQPTPPNRQTTTQAAARPRDAAGHFIPTHAASALEAAYERGKLPRWARRLRNRARFEFAVALGYPSWSSAPAPLRAAIDNAIRNKLLCERLFSGFWTGKAIPDKYHTTSENLRRQLRDLGLTAAQPTVDAAILSAMRTPDSTKETRPRGGSGHGEKT